MVRLHCRNTVVLCLVVLCALFLASSALAERIDVSPAADGYVTYWQNANGSGYTVNSIADTLLCRRITGTDLEDTRPQIEIPISSFRGQNLNGATFTFSYYSLRTAYCNLFGHGSNGDGVITQSDYPAYTGWIVDGGKPSRIGWITCDVTNLVKSQIYYGYSWVVLEFMPNVDTPGEIAAAEDPQGRGAYLDYTPVPEPSSLLTLFAGGSCLAGMIVRRRK